MARPHDAKPVPVMRSRRSVFPTIEIRLGWPTARPLAVAWDECSHTAPLRQTVEMMKAKALRKERLTDVLVASPSELLLLP